MNQSERPSIDSVLKKWKIKYGEARTSDKGIVYRIMPTGPMLQNLKILIKTLLASGYSFEELDHHHVAIKVGKFCWNEEKIIRMSQAETRKCQTGTANDFSEVLAEYSDVKMVELTEDEKLVPIAKQLPKEKELNIEINPKDRIEMDTSDMIEPELDLGFLEQLGIKNE